MALIIFKAPERSAAAPSTPEAVLKSKSRTSEIYTQVKQNPLNAYFGRTQIPDPTLEKFGGGRGFELYYEVRRQITELSGILGQLVDGALKRRVVVVAGDPSVSRSVEIADEMRRVWEDIPYKSVTMQAALDTLITCGFAPIELVWGRDESTGIVAPIGEVRDDGTRGPGLIDRPAQNIVFDEAGNPRFLSVLDPFLGEPIEPLKFIFLQCGTMNTQYGKAMSMDLYSGAWFYQQVRQMMLDAVEKYGRPIPHVLIPRGTDPGEMAEIDDFYTKKFGTYTRAMTDETAVEVQYPSMPMAASGSAGRSEIEVLKFLQGTMYICALRTRQTQGESNASRSLETVRDARTDAAAVLYSDILCEGLQGGWMRPTMQINYPSDDPKLWSRFVLDTTAIDDPDKVHGRVMDGVDRGISYSKQYYFKRFGVQEAKGKDDVLGVPREIPMGTGSFIQPDTPPPNTGATPQQGDDEDDETEEE